MVSPLSILSGFEYEAGYGGNHMNMWMTAEVVFRDQTAEWDQEPMRCLREQHIRVCGIAVGRLWLPE